MGSALSSCSINSANLSSAWMISGGTPDTYSAFSRDLTSSSYPAKPISRSKGRERGDAYGSGTYMAVIRQFGPARHERHVEQIHRQWLVRPGYRCTHTQRQRRRLLQQLHAKL